MESYEAVGTLNERQVSDLVRLYQQAWWATGRTREDVERMLAGTSAFVGLADGSGRLVAFCRILTDRVFRGHVYDVIVDKAYRGKGLTEVLFEHLLAHPSVKGVERVTLDCLEELTGLYERYGFEKVAPPNWFMKRMGPARSDYARKGAASRNSRGKGPASAKPQLAHAGRGGRRPGRAKRA